MIRVFFQNQYLYLDRNRTILLLLIFYNRYLLQIIEIRIRILLNSFKDGLYKNHQKLSYNMMPEKLCLISGDRYAMFLKQKLKQCEIL